MSNDLETIESRVRAIEDQLAIYQLVASYGPGVDSLSEEVVAHLWTEQGVYDSGGMEPFVGASAVGALVGQEPHTSYVESGCGHLLSLPIVQINGDRATATNHSRVYRHNGATWDVIRVSANRWELTGEHDGWRVLRRTNRLLDGSGDARDLLAQGVTHV